MTAEEVIHVLKTVPPDTQVKLAVTIDGKPERINIALSIPYDKKVVDILAR